MNTLISARHFILYSGFFCFMLLSSNLFAQTEETDKLKDVDTSYLRTQKQLPILNNFRFIPSEIVYDPFITTFVKIIVGTGLALDLNSYVKDLDGNIRDTLSGDLTYISGELQFQLAVNDWLAFNLGAGGSGRLGTNTYTILTSGISYTSFLTLGGKAKIWQNDNMVLSTTLDFKYQNLYLYSIYDFVKAVVENEGEIDSTVSLLEKDNISSTILNLNYAYAPTDWCGVLVIAGWGLGEAFETKTRGNVRVGAAFSVDFDNVDFVEFPIGILASVRYNSFGEGGSNVKDIFTYGFKLAYTGHKDFDIGIENTYQSLSYKANEEKIKTILSSFSLRYYF
ncbi:MAG TPA: hypothetical protein VIZ21_06090 [Ignavibacteriaceae bacterium]